MSTSLLAKSPLYIKSYNTLHLSKSTTMILRLKRRASCFERNLDLTYYNSNPKHHSTTTVSIVEKILTATWEWYEIVRIAPENHIYSPRLASAFFVKRMSRTWNKITKTKRMVPLHCCVLQFQGDHGKRYIPSHIIWRYGVEWMSMSLKQSEREQWHQQNSIIQMMQKDKYLVTRHLKSVLFSFKMHIIMY